MGTDVSNDPEAERPASRERTPTGRYGRSVLAIVGASLTLVGSALPWAGLGGLVGPSGLHGDGLYAAVAGLVALGLAAIAPLGPWRRTLCVVLGLVICVVATIDISVIHGALDAMRGDEIGNAVSDALGIGVGLYVTAAGGVFVLVGGLIGE